MLESALHLRQVISIANDDFLFQNACNQLQQFGGNQEARHCAQ